MTMRLFGTTAKVSRNTSKTTKNDRRLAAGHDRPRRRAAADHRVVSSNAVPSLTTIWRVNRLLKADLRNMALLVAQSEHQVFETSHLRTTLTKQRDLLARAYLEEVRAATRKAITATNYPASKRRMQDAIDRLASAGVRPTAAGERQIMNELHQQYEAAVRASVERENQARIREQIREEQRREREAQEAIEQAEQERRTIERALQKALSDVAGVHAAEIERLRAQLAEAEAKSMRAISLAQITNTGYVYVISNIGSFGHDVFKVA